MKRFVGDDAGQTLVLFTLLLTVLVFSVGIAFDLGTLFVARRTLQEAADAAAFGAAVAYYDNGGDAQAQAAAITDFEFNGFSTTDPNITFTVTTASPSPEVYVTVTEKVRTPLLPAEGGLSTVTVHAHAGSVATPSGYALLTLDPQDPSGSPGSLYLHSTGTVTVNNADVQVDSSSATAAAMTSGGFVLGSGVEARAVGGQSGFTNMLTGQASIADPFSGYLRPSLTGLQNRGTVSISSDTTLQPGYYKNININCSTPCTVTFASGMYVLLGSGISANGSATLTGTGVTFFNTLQNYPTEQGSCGPFNVKSTANVTISAATSGYYAGMIIFQDPSCTQTLQINANGPINSSNGSIYAPTAKVQIGGSNTLTIGGQLIAKDVEVQDQASVTINYDPSTVASPKAPSLMP